MLTRKNLGFTLLELLVAMAIGLIVVASLWQIFALVQKTILMNKIWLEMQENMRIVSYILRTKIETAGYLGCPRIADNLPIYSSEKALPLEINDNLLVFQGLGAKWLPHLPPVLNQAPNSDSDVILIRSAAENIDELQQPILKGENKIILIKPLAFKKFDNVIIADCMHVYADSISSANQKTLLLNHSITTSFHLPTQVGEFSTIIFYIAPVKNKTNDEKDINALFMQENGRREEIVSGVEKMQVECLVEKNNEVHYFLPGQINDWQQVKALKINLLFRSNIKIDSNVKAYSFMGKKYLSKNGYYYKAVSLVIALKERI